MATLRFTTKAAGISTEVLSVVLCDPTGTYGIKSTGNGAIKIAANTPMLSDGVGSYYYNYTEDQTSTSYTAWIKCTQSDLKISFLELTWTSAPVDTSSTIGSKLIPQETVDVLRSYTDVVLDAFGIMAVLYIPNTASYDTAAALDAYSVPSNYVFNNYNIKCWIEWGPSTYRLKKLGLFVEDDVPLVVWLPNTDTSGTPIDPVIHSYIKIHPQYIPGKVTGTEEFELVNVASRGMHNAMVVQAFAAVPRRV